MNREHLTAYLISTFTGTLSPVALRASAIATAMMYSHTPDPGPEDIATCVAVAIDGVLNCLDKAVADHAGKLELAAVTEAGHG